MDEPLDFFLRYDHVLTIVYVPGRFDQTRCPMIPDARPSDQTF